MGKIIITDRKLLEVILPYLNRRTNDFLDSLDPEGQLSCVQNIINILLRKRHDSRCMIEIEHDEGYHPDGHGSATIIAHVSSVIDTDVIQSMPISYRFLDSFEDSYESFILRTGDKYKFDGYDNFNECLYDDLENLRIGFAKLIRLIESPVLGYRIANCEACELEGMDQLRYFYSIKHSPKGGLEITL